MTDAGLPLRNRLLLWHKVLAQLTGTLSLCYGGSGLRKASLMDWVERLRSVADDIQAVAENRAPVLDEQGLRMMKSLGATAPTEGVSVNSEKSDEVTPERSGRRQPGSGTTGPRVATRKK